MTNTNEKSERVSVAKPKGLSRIFKATIYSYRGLVSAWRHEAAFRQELVSAAILIPLAFWLSVSKVERVAMIGTVVLVLIVELMNSAVEAAVDRVGLERHELAGRAKDMGSAAVLLSLIFWAYVWISILVF